MYIKVTMGFNHITKVLLFLGWVPLFLQAETSLKFSNSKTNVHFIELYTSQGCHSCPPAEKWLNGWLNKGQKSAKLWKSVFPVAFHVTYWDYLGWKDPFSHEDYTERQNIYSDHKAIRSIYTPCFVINGKEWRGWFEGEGLPKPSAFKGLLEAELTGDQLSLRYVYRGNHTTPYNFYVSITESHIQTNVKSGENKGKELEQEFVSVYYQVLHSKSSLDTLNIPQEYTQGKGKYALVTWVTESDKMVPLQVTGGWLKRK